MILLHFQAGKIYYKGQTDLSIMVAVAVVVGVLAMFGMKLEAVEKKRLQQAGYLQLVDLEGMRYL